MDLMKLATRLSHLNPRLAAVLERRLTAIPQVHDKIEEQYDDLLRGLEAAVKPYRAKFASLGCSVTGGVVYRGRAYPLLDGTYLYGDYCSGRIWGLRKQDGRWRLDELADTKLSISTFGEDEAGEVYVADHDGGGIYRIEPVPRTGPR